LIIISYLFAGEEQSLTFRFDVILRLDELFQLADLRRPGRLYHKPLAGGHVPNYHVHGGGGDIPVRQRCFTSVPVDSNTVYTTTDASCTIPIINIITEACARGVRWNRLARCDHVFELTLASKSGKWRSLSRQRSGSQKCEELKYGVNDNGTRFSDDREAWTTTNKRAAGKTSGRYRSRKMKRLMAIADRQKTWATCRKNANAHGQSRESANDRPRTWRATTATATANE